jgi:hypothetical protein
MRVKFLTVSSTDSNALSCGSLFPYYNPFLNNPLTHQSRLFRCLFLFIKIRCITLKDIAARALGDVMVASHELRFVLSSMIASFFKKRHPRQLTVEAASRSRLTRLPRNVRTRLKKALRSPLSVVVFHSGRIHSRPRFDAHRAQDYL